MVLVGMKPDGTRQTCNKLGKYCVVCVICFYAAVCSLSPAVTAGCRIILANLTVYPSLRIDDMVFLQTTRAICTLLAQSLAQGSRTENITQRSLPDARFEQQITLMVQAEARLQECLES